MNIPGSTVPKSTTERVLKRNYAMKSAGIEQQQQPNWLDMLGQVATQALQVPKPYKATDIGQDVGAAYSGTGAGQAGPPKKDLLGGIGAGIQGILKYAATPEGRQLMSGLISDPYTASNLAVQAEQEQAEQRAAERERTSRALDVVSGLGMQEMRGTQAEEAAAASAQRREEEAGKERKFEMEEKEKQRKFTREEAEKNRKLEQQKIDATIQKARDKAKKDAKGRDLPANKATDLGDQQGSLDMLDQLMRKAGTIKGLTYTIADKATAIANPWAVGVQTFNQMVAATKQVIGKGLEGGVLRAEDEKKYEKIIPKLGDTKKVLQNKANQLRSLLVNKRNNTVNSLGKAGFDISNFSLAKEKTYDIFGNQKGNQRLRFNSVAEAEAADIPVGTEFFINGRRAIKE